MLRDGRLDVYQRFQSNPVFDDCDHIVVFIGEEGTRSRLVGVYRVGDRSSGIDVPLPGNCPEEWRCEHHYRLTKLSGLDDLENRLVVDWGRAAIAWNQWLRTDKEVLEVSPPGQTRPPFSDYLEFSLTHQELIDLVDAPDANREWRARLEAVGGVYLVLAGTTGQQYLGSATGTRGIWGRWVEYAKTGHGGNKALRELIEANPAYPGAFQYSLLYVFPKTMTRAEALERERRCKEKLGTTAQGLNLNL